MIRLEVEPYCEDCLVFDPDVESPQKVYCGCDLVSKTVTIVRCSYRNRCAGIKRYLEREMKKEENTNG